MNNKHKILLAAIHLLDCPYKMWKKSRSVLFQLLLGTRNLNVGPHFSISNFQLVHISSGFSCGSQVRLHAFMCEENIGSKVIRIGSNVFINNSSFLSAKVGITIEANVLIGSNVFICDNSHGNPSIQFSIDESRLKAPVISKGPILISKGAWLCNNVVILPGVTVGYGAIVAANSVVSKDVEPFPLVGGVPARMIRRLARLN